MFDFYEKRRIRRILYSLPVLAVLIVCIFILSVSVYHRYIVANESNERLKERQLELDAIKQRATVLDEKVEYLKNERGIEEELRNRFDVAKEGEQVIILLDSDGEQPKEPEVSEPLDPEEKWYQFWR